MMRSENQTIQPLRVQTKCILLSLLLMLYFGGVTSMQAQWTSSGGNTTTTDKVGIGTTGAPSQKLDVVGNILLDSSANWYGINKASGEARAVMFNGAVLSDSDYLYFGSLNNGFKFVDASNNPLMTIQNGGNVGIGETSPTRSLTIRKDVANGVGAGIYLQNNQYANNSGAETEIIFGHLQSGGSPLRYARIHSLGADPYGSVNSFSLGLTDNTDTYRDRLTILQNGNIGIGESAPVRALTVRKDVANGVGAGIYLNNNQYASNSGAETEIIFGHLQSSGAPLRYARIHSLGADPYGSVNSFSLGLTDNTDTYQDRVTILQNGNVGIGTPSPGSYRLNVNGDTSVAGNLNIVANGTSAGNIVAAGTIAAKYQDVAEWVPSSEELSAGTVVVLDSTKSNQVTSSTVSYDTRVAGVISEQPGIALGEKSDGKVLVATTGRVRVKVDATKSPIHIGDLLVTSDVPGMAMKSDPVEFAGRKMHMPGTLIGKALEPLEKGKGEILVLLSLQ